MTNNWIYCAGHTQCDSHYQIGNPILLFARFFRRFVHRPLWRREKNLSCIFKNESDKIEKATAPRTKTKQRKIGWGVWLSAYWASTFSILDNNGQQSIESDSFTCLLRAFIYKTRLTNLRSSVSVRPKFNESPHESTAFTRIHYACNVRFLFLSALIQCQIFSPMIFLCTINAVLIWSLPCRSSYRLKIAIVFQTDLDETKMWVSKCSIEMALNLGQTLNTFIIKSTDSMGL